MSSVSLHIYNFYSILCFYNLPSNVDIDNIRTMSANIKFICTSYRNRQKSECLANFLSTFVTNANEFYICRQCLFIVFILQCQKVQRQLLNYAENSRKKRRSKRLLCEVRAYTVAVLSRQLHLLDTNIVCSGTPVTCYLLSFGHLIIPTLAEWWVYWNTLVRPSVRSSVPKPCVRNQSFVSCWILFIFGILVGHDLSMRILYRFHGWFIFVRVIALFIFVLPYVGPHILCTELVICLLSHFIHIWYPGWP